ncbi:MAG: hypothetical protein IPK52_27130 [Chloroflexi bacterium]|nr:hypothetical protein [Chloroflexota bacterium]
MPTLAMPAHAFQPTSKGSIRMTGEADKHRHIHPLSQKPQRKLDPFRVSFQIVERRVDPAGKDFATRLALEALDPVVRAVANQRMDGRIRDAVIVTTGVGTSEPVRCYRFLATAAALALPIGLNIGFRPDHL